MKARKEIAIYGKGGIGKSTTSCHISAALGAMGYKVLQVGCDPKSDSTTALMGGVRLPTILDEMRRFGISEESFPKLIRQGAFGVWCTEAGGPMPGADCSGKGVAMALDLLVQYKVREKLVVDVVVYDVLGDVVCGGFAQPMRRGYAHEIYLVTSGELLALYAANNIARAVNYIASQGADTAIAGIIVNQRNVAQERDLLEEFASRLGLPIMAFIPRSELIQKAELQRKTVIELFPETEIAQVYFNLAKAILANEERLVANPMEMDDIVSLLNKYQMVPV